MNRFLLPSLCLLGLFASGVNAQPPQAGEPDANTAAARAAAAELGKRLKTELQAAMQQGGAIAALGVCQVRAPQIADEISKQAGLQIRRTSLRTRNADNRPDVWELEGLLNFDRQRSEGVAPDKMELSAIVTEDSRREFRYLKAIPTADLCLKCHGERLAPELTAELAKRYPEDQATGFKTGDIRGAFSVRKPLD